MSHTRPITSRRRFGTAPPDAPGSKRRSRSTRCSNLSKTCSSRQFPSDPEAGCLTSAAAPAARRWRSRERLGAKGRCIGIDISDPMIAAARSRAEREGTPANFIRANAQAHTFEPASFDIDHFALWRDVLRGLRPRLCEPAACRGGERRAPVHRLAECGGKSVHDDGRARRGAAPAEPARPPAGRAGAVRLRGSATASTPFLKESGWADIDIRPIDVACTLPEKDLIRYLTRLGPVGRILQEADDRTRTQVIETVRAAFDPYVHGAEVRFTAACWMVRAQARSVSAPPDSVG